MTIPFFSLDYMHGICGADLQKAFHQVLQSNHFVLGKHLSGFETNYAAYAGVKYCIGVKSGLDALQLSLIALGIGKGDEVIVPAHTYVASVLAVLKVGAIPVLVDPVLTTGLITAKATEPFINSNTRAIMPVHLYGQACAMHEFTGLGQKYDLFIVEDNAQAHGVSLLGKKTGSFGHINATSFYPSKNLGALGDGGAITTHGEDLFNKLLALRNVGLTAPYQHSVQGFNTRLDELQAALLTVKLKYLNQWNALRKENAKRYFSLLNGIDALHLPHIEHGEEAHVFHQFVVRTAYRNALASFLKEHGIGTHIHYPIPIHLQEVGIPLGYKKGSLPITEEFSQTCLSLPIYPGLRKNQIEYIAEKIRTFFDKI